MKRSIFIPFALLIATVVTLVTTDAAARAANLPRCGTKITDRFACKKDWTVLVYMEADNDLFPYALWDLYEMEAAPKTGRLAASSARSDLVVEVNGRDQGDLRLFHVEAQQTPFKKKTFEDFASAGFELVKSPMVARYSGTDSSTERRLTRFLKLGAAAYPADHYLVVMWGHGEGWRGRKKSDFGGIGYSETRNSWLRIPALAKALRVFKKETGQAIDLYYADACLMQTAEVLTELAPNVKYLAGTSQIQDYQGYPYRTLMYAINTPALGAPKRDQARSLARLMPKLFKLSYNATNGYQSNQASNESTTRYLTSSSVASEQWLSEVIPSLTKLSGSLGRYFADDPVRRANFTAAIAAVAMLEGQTQDLNLLFGQLRLFIGLDAQRTGPSSLGNELLTDLESAMQSVNRSTLAANFGTLYEFDPDFVTAGVKPSGVSIWLPLSKADFKKRRKDFEISRFYRRTGWSLWLDTLHQD